MHNFVPAQQDDTALIYTANGGFERHPVFAWQMRSTGYGSYAAPIFSFAVTDSMIVAVESGTRLVCQGITYDSKEAFINAIDYI